MRALREKVAPKKDDDVSSSKADENDKETTTAAEKKEVERKKVEQAREVMGVEQLVESNGAEKE